MRILIADDHELLRDVLRSCLEAEGGFAVDTVADLPQALAAIAEAAPPYDLVVLDYGMPGMEGYAGLDKALGASFGRPVALMSGLAPPGVAGRVLDSGAAGYLPKTLPARSLVNAIRFMAAGARPTCRSTSTARRRRLRPRSAAFPRASGRCSPGCAPVRPTRKSPAISTCASRPSSSTSS